ncbi:holin [Streptomyces sp. JJ66]|uniref:holin n=1 Tax=Streptomyces sp. JJ66 TaxID=2803843 RepID=UPI001C5599E1|nr:holin [Streptomyces sp. JJ66]MBW1600884.1 holin [Streptomyces sp. JJ66]
MPRALSVCSTPGCPNLARGRCATCRSKAEQQRGTARQRGYGRQHEQQFRPAVLARDPVCRCPGCPTCTTPSQQCKRASQHADHWPLDRRTLHARGLDPNDPQHGRGLCGRCHSHATARHQPGGWHEPTAG